MHVENELVEYVTPGDQEYEEIVKSTRRRYLYRRSSWSHS
jgi:hypothetical protein